MPDREWTRRRVLAHAIADVTSLGLAGCVASVASHPHRATAKPSSSPSPSPVADAGPPKFPTAATTGPAAAGYTNLTPVTLTANVTLESSPYPSWLTVQGRGTSFLAEGIAFTMGEFIVESYLSNITFRGCTFTGNGFNGESTLLEVLAGDNITVEFCQFSGLAPIPGSANIPGGGVGAANSTSNFNCRNNNIFWVIYPVGPSGSNADIRFNYCHDFATVPADHCDGLLANGNQSGLTIAQNTFLVNEYSGTDAVIATLNNVSGGFSDITIEENLIAGAATAINMGYTGASGDPYSNYVVQGNWFSTRYFPNCGYYQYADYSPPFGSNGNVWQDNYWLDGPNAGQAVATP